MGGIWIENIEPIDSLPHIYKKSLLKGSGGMKYVMEALRRQEAKEKIPVIRMEIDYELVTLYDALQADDHVQVIKSKERLKQLRKQMIEIENEE